MRRFFLIASVFFILLRLPSLFEPYWYGDEGIYLTLGQGIRSGLTLYSQIHDNKPPTLYYLAAFSQTVFGFRLLLMVWMIPTIILFYRFSRSKLATLIFLILTSIPLIEGNIANSEIFMLLPTIAGMLLFLSHYHFLAGLFLGIAFTFKVPVAAELGFLLFWLLFYDFKNLKQFLLHSIRITLGFALPIFVWGIYFFYQASLAPFLHSALFQNFGYISSWTTGSHSGSVTQGGLVIRFVVFLLALIVTRLAFFRQPKNNRPLAFILSWFYATIFGALLSARPYPHYLIQVLPPLCLLIPYYIKQKYLLIFPALFILIASNFKFYSYPSLSYYQNFYGYLLGQKSLPSYNSFFGSTVNQSDQIARYIKDRSSTSDRLFVWGDRPSLFLLSTRLPATKYIVAYHIVDFKAHQSTLEELTLRLPKFIVYFPNPSRPYPDLDQFINRYYFLVNQIGSALIFQLR